MYGRDADDTLDWIQEKDGVIASEDFGQYLTCMITNVPPYKTFSLIKNNILHQSKNYKNHFEFLRYVTFHNGHVTYNFINILFIDQISCFQYFLSNYP
jgi:hypothetical protein